MRLVSVLPVRVAAVAAVVLVAVVDVVVTAVAAAASAVATGTSPHRIDVDVIHAASGHVNHTVRSGHARFG